MKRFLIILAILFSVSSIFSQQPADNAAVPDSITADSVAAAEPVAVLSDEEKLCKQAADDFMVIFNDWDITRDYNILLPRITAYADNYFKTGTEPNESNKKDLLILKENYETLLGMETSETLMNLLSMDIERVNAELEGNQKNPALIGWLEKSDFDKIKALEEALVREDNPEISRSVEALRSSFKNIRRYTIGFDEMLNKIYSEITRVTDKRTYFLYIEDNVKDGLQKISVDLADYVRTKDAEFRKQMKADVDTLYISKNEAAAAGEKDKEKQLYSQWIEARKVNIDKINSIEISRLTGVMAKFMQSPGQYDVNSELINKLRSNSPELKEYLEHIIKAKFYNDINAKFKNYFRFEVEKGFRTYRTNVLIASFFFFGLFFYVFTTVKKKRDSIYIRRIPGLDAIDDAVGRATEMGKPVIYDSGLGGFSSPQTIASMLILRSIAKKVAEFKAEIIYPAYDPVVLQVAEEMIASGFLDAGYPEDHKKDNCFFMVQDQFAFAAGLSGLISRKKPATAFHFGHYAAESLLISEAGFAAGAIQVAGTTEATQLPFFITSCDYTLIGEELYAAAAYMSRDAQVLSNLKLSDYGKIIFGILFLLGTILLTINSDWTIIADLLSTH
jgi:hypothetical protein